MDIRATLEQAGVAVQRESASEVHAPCPQHVERTGAPDVHPSWSINKTTGNHYCFSCHYGGTLTQLLIDLTGAAPPDLETELHEQAFLRRMEAVRADPETVLDPILTEWALWHIMQDVPEKLLEFRWLHREAIDRYQVRWNPTTKQWVLPLRDAGGTLQGAQYRQRGSVLTLPEGMKKSTILFGFGQARSFDFTVVVESPLDAVRLAGLGISSLATLGAYISREQVTLMARNFTYVILALDRDVAGERGYEVARSMFRKAKTPVIKWDYTGLQDDTGKPAKDVGDVPSDDQLLGAWDRTRRFGL